MARGGDRIEFGVVLQGVYPPAEFRSMAAEIEALGYSHLWITDSSLHAHDVYPFLTLAALSTSRLKLGTAVTNPLSRHPAITANAIATVAAIAEGRVILGLGAGDRPLLALGLRPASLELVARTVEICRALLAGETAEGEAGHLQLRGAHMRMRCPSPPPIWLAASGPRMLRLAGEVADGAIVLAGLFPEAISFALDSIRAGLAKAPSPRREAHGLTVFMYGAIDEDEAVAVEKARSIAAWFPQTAPHYSQLAGMDADLVERIRAQYAGGEFQEAAAAARLIPDSLVQKLALAGGRRHCIEKVEMLAGLGVRNVAFFPLGSERFAMVREFARQVMPAFAGAR